MTRTLQYRANNGYDSILLMDGETVIGAWTVDDDVRRQWEQPGDLEDWSPTYPDETDPDAYGELVV